jgi:hypothetical protein
MRKSLKRRKKADKAFFSKVDIVSIEVFNRLREASKGEYGFQPKINRNDLIKAKEYLWVFLHLFITDDMNNYPHDVMPMLNSSQQTFLTFFLLDNSISCGSFKESGFLRLIYDGYDEYVFEKPFSKIIKAWGAKKISKIVENARSPYEKHKDKIKKVKTLKELSDLSSEITDFEILNDKYMTASKEVEIIKIYIENNLSEFAIIDEDNTQINYIDKEIEEMENRKRIFEESKIIDEYIETHIKELTMVIENDTLVINASDIFCENNTLINSLSTEIDGKRVTIEIQK